MKKGILILLIVGGLGFLSYKIYGLVKDVVPYEENMKLYISCNGVTKSFEVLTGSNYTFLETDNDCKLDFEVRNISRDYIKLYTKTSFYQIDGNKEIDNTSSISDIYVVPNEKLLLYKSNKTTKYYFEFK